MGNVPKIQREEGKIGLSFSMAEEGVWEGVCGPHLGPTPPSGSPADQAQSALWPFTFFDLGLSPSAQFLNF